MTTTPDTERRERYAAAIRDRVRVRFGAHVLALAEQGRPLKMSFSEAEVAADAAITVADFEIDAAKFQAGEQWAKEYAEAALLRAEAAEVRADAFDEAADAIDTETRLTKLSGVLEPDTFRPCRDASAQLRRMAAAARPDCPGETDPPTCNCDCAGCLHHCAAHRPDNTTGA